MNTEYLHRRRDFELQSALKHFPRVKENRKIRVLDLGAGTGRQAATLQALGYSTVAVDLPTSVYAAGRDFDVVDYDGKTLPFCDNALDVIFSSNVLEHVSHIDDLLSEIRRVLGPGGMAIHVLPSPAWRVWTTLLHPAWIAKRTMQIALGRPLRHHSVDGGDQVKKANPWWHALLPSRHGERGTLLSEAYYFSAPWWRRKFLGEGFAIETDYPTGLFYSGCQILGGALPMDARRWLSHMLGSSCRVYITRTSDRK